MPRLCELEEQLQRLIDPDYKTFGDRLQPGIHNRLGVRMPALRRLTKEILKKNPIGFLEEALDHPGRLTSQEAVMIAAIVLARTEMPADKRLAFLDRLLPYLDGWATVDLTGGELKLFREDSPILRQYLTSLLSHERPMAVRLGLVILLSHWASEKRIPEALGLLSASSVYRLAPEHYLLSMGLAWLYATFYPKTPALLETRLIADLREKRLDTVTLARTLQKIRDSRRVSVAEKARLTARFSALIARKSSNLA